MAQKIVIVDYGMGNLNSVRRKLERLKTDCEISNDPQIIAKADKLILPGVGHFGKAMQNISSNGILEILQSKVLQEKTPILGICLGMQLMCNSSTEGDAQGLGWIDASVEKFNVSEPQKFKIPHMGWNTIDIKTDSELMKNIPNHTEFYFVHAYHAVIKDKRLILNETEYDYTFVSGFQKENIFGVQYHPEKSHEFGDQLFQNFIDL